jgi:hypothetical protein
VAEHSPLLKYGPSFFPMAIARRSALRGGGRTQPIQAGRRDVTSRAGRDHRVCASAEWPNALLDAVKELQGQPSAFAELPSVFRIAELCARGRIIHLEPVPSRANVRGELGKLRLADNEVGPDLPVRMPIPEEVLERREPFNIGRARRLDRAVPQRRLQEAVDVIRTPPLKVLATDSAALLGTPQRPLMPACQRAKLVDRIAVLAPFARALAHGRRSVLSAHLR